MAHQIDVLNGDKFVTGGLPAWHSINTMDRPLTDLESRNVGAVLAASGMDWLAYKRPLTSMLDGVEVEIPDHVAIVRGDNKRILGVVGSEYGLIQHTSVFQDMQQVIDANVGMGIDCLFTMDRGAKQVMTLRFKDPVVIKGDTSENTRHLLFRNSYDGSCNMDARAVTTRVVCANTVRVALGEGTESVRIRHTKSGPERVAVLADAMAKVTAAHNTFVDKANWLADRTFTDSMMKALGEHLFLARKGKTVTKADDATGRTKANLDGLVDSWNDPTNDGIRGNAWGAFNAVTHWINHGASYRNTGSGSTENMVDSVVFGGNAALADAALQQISVMVA